MIKPLDAHVLMISTDRNIFKHGSTVRERMIAYGGLVNKLSIIVFTTKSQSFIPEQISSNVWVYPTQSRIKILYPYDAVLVARREFIKKNILVDLITTQDPFETGWSGAQIAKRMKKPLQVQIHTDFLDVHFKHESSLNRLRVRLARQVVQQATTIRVVSERIKQSIEKKYSALKNIKDKISILPICINVQKIQQQEVQLDLHKKYPNADVITLMASRITSEKDIPTAIKAFDNVVKIYPKAILIIVGDGKELSVLKKQVKDIGLEKNILFEPWQADLTSYYKTADLFLLTSRYEGYGLVLIEALASGLPVITTDVGIASQLLGHVRELCICPVGDSVCIADNIINVITTPELRTTIVSSSQKYLLSLAGTSEYDYLQKHQELWQKTLSDFNNLNNINNINKFNK